MKSKGYNRIWCKQCGRPRPRKIYKPHCFRERHTYLRTLSSVLDYLWKDFTKSYLILLFNVKLPVESILVAIVVTSIYTKMPYLECILAKLGAYLRTDPQDHLDKETLSTLVRLIFNYHNFTFEGRHFLQVNGTPMVTEVVPPYTNKLI